MWRTVQIFYYEEDKESLLLDAVRPVVRTIHERFDVERVYVRRHWKLAPHVDVNLYVEAEEQWERDVLPYVQASLATYVAAHPSKRLLERQMYMSYSKKLGALELDPGPYGPLQPDNSIRLVPYTINRGVFQNEQLTDLKERFMVQTLECVFQILKRTRGNMSKRLPLLLMMMAIIAEQYPKGITYGHLSFRSHVESYFYQFDQNGQLRYAFEKQDQAMAEQVDAVISEVLQAMDDQGSYHGEDQLLSTWTRALQTLWQKSFYLSESGRLNDRVDHYKEVAEQIGEEVSQCWNNEERSYSDFHTHLLSQQEWKDMLKSAQFLAYRMLVNHYYFLLPLFGINANQKYLLCHLISNSIERIKGTSWEELLGYKQIQVGQMTKPNATVSS